MQHLGQLGETVARRQQALERQEGIDVIRAGPQGLAPGLDGLTRIVQLRLEHRGRRGPQSRL